MARNQSWVFATAGTGMFRLCVCILSEPTDHLGNILDEKERRVDDKVANAGDFSPHLAVAGSSNGTTKKFLGCYVI